MLLLGDTHRNEAFIRKAFVRAQELGCEHIIQLGDFGYGWSWLQLNDTLAVCRFSAAVSMMVDEFGISCSFLDGNHENFDQLGNHPLGPDGRREVAPNVWHLPRGHRWEVDGIRFLVCGGATSVDRMARTPSVSWWAAEAVTQGDVETCGTEVTDVLLTHDAPMTPAFFENVSTTRYGIQADLDVLRNKLLLEQVMVTTEPRVIVHGHLHRHFIQDLGGGQRMIGLAHDRAAIHRAALVIDTQSNELVEFLEKPTSNHVNAGGS